MAYQSPATRRKMGGGVPPISQPDDQEKAESDEFGESPEQEKSEPVEGATAFLPKSALGGREFKEGDTIEMEVTGVDPESGEVEVKCSPEMYDEKPKSSMDAMDSAMPDNEED